MYYNVKWINLRVNFLGFWDGGGGGYMVGVLAMVRENEDDGGGVWVGVKMDGKMEKWEGEMGNWVVQ